MDLTNPDHAYLLGLLQTDGSHYAGTGQKGKITLEVSARDAPLLYELQRIVPYYTSVRMRTRTTNFAEKYESATWSLCSLEARRQFSALGLPVGRKSETITPPTGEFSRVNYLRGLIDGDGSVGFTAKGYPFVGFVTASAAIAEFFCAEMKSIAGVNRTPKRNARDKVFNLIIANDPAHAFVGALYYKNCLGLPRKIKTAGEIAKWVRPAGMRARPLKRRAWTEAEDAIVLKLSIKDAAAKLDRTEQSVNLRRWRLRRGVISD